MPIIMAIISGAFFWFCFWLFRLDGHLKIEGWFRDWRTAKRRAIARDLEARAPIRMITDPREAGTVLLFLIAKLKGDYSAAQLAGIEQEMRGVMSIEGDLAPFVSYARWACTSTAGVTATIRDVAPLLNERLTSDERRDLLDMVERVANIDGPPNDDQAAALTALRAKLSPPELPDKGFGFSKPRD